jgi:hypothetical protein
LVFIGNSRELARRHALNAPVWQQEPTICIFGTPAGGSAAGQPFGALSVILALKEITP